MLLYFLFTDTHHFTRTCHKKYEEERLDDREATRLKDSKEAYLKLNPIPDESNIFRSKKRRTGGGGGHTGVDELRVQEAHWMAMWKDSKNELKQMREDLKNEDDEEVRAEMMADIEGLKKRKGDWAKLLGLNEVAQPEVAQPISASI